MEEGKMDLNKIKCSRSYVGKSPMCSGNKYRVRMSYNGETISFYFHDNFKNESGKKDYLYSLLVDMCAYGSTDDVYEFMREFGYSDYEEAQRIRNACKRNGDKVHKLFNEREIDELTELLSDY